MWRCGHVRRGDCVQHSSHHIPHPDYLRCLRGNIYRASEGLASVYILQVSPGRCWDQPALLARSDKNYLLVRDQVEARHSLGAGTRGSGPEWPPVI